MLSLGPASSCDICYERFGQDAKAPWSIECGHVFCGECLQNVNDPRLCPMCRSPFEQESCIKLHVDIDSAPSEPTAAEAANAKEARRLQHAIASIPETGATEPSLRQLIQEGSKFLSTQPRSSYKDLRNAHRIIKYLYDVKMLHRQQAQAIESAKEQANQLTKEKADLLKQLEKLEETRQYENETATAVENTLREHCAQAKQAQNLASEQLKKLKQENEDLKTKLQATSSNRWNIKTAYTPPESVAADKYFEIPEAFNKLNMSSIALQDSSSFLISPLPQFTSTLPATFDNFAPLPDLAEDEDESQGASTDEEDEEAVTPDGSQHQQQLRPAETRDLRPQSVPDTVERSLPAPRAPQEPSGLSRTAPFREHRRRERSSSSPTRPTSRSRSPFDSIITSTPTTPPASAFHLGTSSRDAAHLPPSTQLRSRLQDLLSDVPISSSLPSSSTFPSSLSRAMHKDDRSYAGPSRSSEAIMSTAPYASTSQTMSSKPPPPSSSLVGPRMSSASAEAKKLEEERRRKHREEKYGADYDKVPADPEREHRRYHASSGSTSQGTSSASQAAWREHQPYGNPLFSDSTSSLKRSSTTSGSYGRPSNPALQDQGAVPPNRHLYGSMSNKNLSKGSALPASHGPSILI